MQQSKYNKFILGILVSLATIFVGFAVVSLIFELLESAGIMDEAYGEAYSKRIRTKWLISICCNVIGIQALNKRKFSNIQRGIAVTTFIAAFVWFFYFKDSLLFIEG